MTFDEFLQKVGITEDVYMKYLNINQKTGLWYSNGEFAKE